MNNEQEKVFQIGPEIAVDMLKRSLMSGFGFTEDKLNELDPYKWANHEYRCQLWIINHYIELVEPKDPKAQFNLLMSTRGSSPVEFVGFVTHAVSAFRHLDSDDVDSFQKNIQDLGFKINQMPPSKGPWKPYLRKT